MSSTSSTKKQLVEAPTISISELIGKQNQQQQQSKKNNSNNSNNNNSAASTSSSTSVPQLSPAKQQQESIFYHHDLEIAESNRKVAVAQEKFDYCLEALQTFCLKKVSTTTTSLDDNNNESEQKTVASQLEKKIQEQEKVGIVLKERVEVAKRELEVALEVLIQAAKSIQTVADEEVSHKEVVLNSVA